MPHVTELAGGVRVLLRQTLVLAGTLLMARGAVAQERSVSVELLVARDQQPDVVCIITPTTQPSVEHCAFEDGAKPRAFVRDLDGTAAWEDKREQQSEACVAAVQAALRSGCTVGSVADANATRTTCAEGMKVETSVTPPRAALCAMNSQASGAARDTPELGPAPSTSPTTRAPRLLLLRLLGGPYNGVEPALRGLSLNGTQLALRLDRVRGRGMQAAAHLDVFGGHYLAGRAAVSLQDGERFTFELTPHVMRRKLVAPPFAPGQTLYWTARAADGAPLRDGVLRSSAPTVIDVPAAAQQVSLEAASFSATASWLGDATPPSALTPALTRVDFSWQFDCSYNPAAFRQAGRAHSHCPIAGLVNTPGQCKPVDSDEDSCTYSCSSEVPFSLPQRVQLTAETDAHQPYPKLSNQWEVLVRQAGDTVEGYLPAPDRFALLDFTAWPEPPEEVPVGERVRSVALWARSSGTMRVSSKPGWYVRLPLPGLTCGEGITYQFEGDLRYSPETREVGSCAGGRCPAVVRIDEPSATLDEQTTLGLTLGGGGSRHLSEEVNGNGKWFASAEVIARFNLRAAQALDFPPLVELRAGAMLSYLWARGLSDTESAHVDRALLYWRAPVTVHAVLPFTFLTDLYWGLGAGVGLGRAVHNRDIELAPTQLFPIASTLLGVRIDPNLAFEVRLQATYERAVKTTLADYGSAPSLDDEGVVSLFASGALRVDL